MGQYDEDEIVYEQQTLGKLDQGSSKMAERHENCDKGIIKKLKVHNNMF